jgi:hypothetical protein
MTDSNSGELRFHEIEHKFVVGDDFDLEAFAAKLEALRPTRKTSIRVRDTYYLLDTEASPRFVIRHRYDEELHHLTLKTVEADTQVRREINLDLGHHAGDQRAQVEAFLGLLGVAWSGSLEKDLRVWYFADAEVVHYRATTGERAVSCVEFEATRKPSLPEALEVLERYERATGFDRDTRSHRSLVQILFPEVNEWFS